MTNLRKRLAKNATRRIVLALLTTLAVIGGSALAVSAAPSKPDFSISGSPSTAVVGDAQSVATSFTVHVQRSGGFAGSVALAASGLPAGATGTFSPTTVPANGSSSTLQVVTSDRTAPGKYKLTISGTGTPGTNSDTVTLDVQDPGFTISGNLASALTLGGSGQPLDLVITNPFHQPLTVSGITVSVQSTSKSTCPTNQFSVTQMPSSYSVTIPKMSTMSLSQLGSQYMPQVVWLDLPYPQNSCLGAHLTFSYSANGQR